MTTQVKDGTVDITDLVGAFRDSFIIWGEEYTYGVASAHPGLSWVRLPIVSVIVRYIIRGILSVIVRSTAMQAFFLNTALRKAGQGQDYINAVRAKEDLPAGASDEDYEKAEQAEMRAFVLCVMVTD